MLELSIPDSRRADLLSELKVALAKTSKDDMAEWGGRCSRLAGASALRRARNLGSAARWAVNALRTEAARVRSSDSIGSYAATRRADLFGGLHSSAAILRKVVDYAQAKPNETAIRVCLFCLGFGYASGGLDADGGIPDLDWRLLDEHRSLLTHSVVPGILAEVVVAAFVDLVSVVHSKLPDPHDPLWDSLLSGSAELRMLVVGVSAGLAYHLGVDATADGGGVYSDLPVSVPQDAHQAVAAGFAGAEGADALLRGRRQPSEPRPVDSQRVTVRCLDDASELYAACADCRRTVALDVVELIGRFGTKVTIPQIRKRLKCTKCGKRTGNVRVVYNTEPAR